MAPKLSEEEIDDVLYFSRVGENQDLSECLLELAEREKVSEAEILVETKNEGKSTALHMAAGNGHLGMSHSFIVCTSETTALDYSHEYTQSRSL